MRASTASKLKAGQNRRITPQLSRARTAMFWTMCLQGGRLTGSGATRLSMSRTGIIPRAFSSGSRGSTPKAPGIARLADLRSRGKRDEDGNAVLSLRNKFAAGDEVELVGPDCEPFSWIAGGMQDMDGLPLTEPRTPQMRFRARLPKQVPAMSFVRHAVELSGK